MPFSTTRTPCRRRRVEGIDQDEGTRKYRGHVPKGRVSDGRALGVQVVSQGERGERWRGGGFGPWKA